MTTAPIAARLTASRAKGISQRCALCLLWSLAFILPCIWQSRIQAVDLPSHLYNAWLATLIHQNQAPGIWITNQSNNILFDCMLTWLLPRVGAIAAQRIAVSFCVLVFGWGMIIFISRGWPKNWWFVLPSVLTLSYGTIFRVGFFNFYLSLGFCLWFLAALLSGQKRLLPIALALLVPAWLAHPLPVLWAVGLGSYSLIASGIAPSRRIYLLALGICAIVAGSVFLSLGYLCVWMPWQSLYFTGANELLISRSYAISFILLLIAWVFLFRRLLQRMSRSSFAENVSLHFWILNAAAVILIPDGIFFPQYSRPFEFITPRLSLCAAVTLCSVLIEIDMSRIEKTLLLASAITFFGVFYGSTRNLNQVEDKIYRVVSQLPVRARVIGHFDRVEGDLPPLLHAIDGACVGHCFSYANYEPATAQFRVRALPLNGIVMNDPRDVVAVERGNYRVKPQDLPLFLVYSCGPESGSICSRQLQAGDDIGVIAREP